MNSNIIGKVFFKVEQGVTETVILDPSVLVKIYITEIGNICRNAKEFPLTREESKKEFLANYERNSKGFFEFNLENLDYPIMIEFIERYGAHIIGNREFLIDNIAYECYYLNQFEYSAIYHDNPQKRIWVYKGGDIIEAKISDYECNFYSFGFRDNNNVLKSLKALGYSEL